MNWYALTDTIHIIYISYIWFIIHLSKSDDFF